jgi:hypothetical protein
VERTVIVRTESEDAVLEAVPGVETGCDADTSTGVLGSDDVASAEEVAGMVSAIEDEAGSSGMTSA